MSISIAIFLLCLFFGFVFGVISTVIALFYIFINMIPTITEEYYGKG